MWTQSGPRERKREIWRENLGGGCGVSHVPSPGEQLGRKSSQTGTLYLWIFEKKQKPISYSGACCLSSSNEQVESTCYQVLHVETGIGTIFLLRKRLCFSSGWDERSGPFTCHPRPSFSPRAVAFLCWGAAAIWSIAMQPWAVSSIPTSF